MALISADRAAVSTQYQRDRVCPGGFTKTDLAAAVAAVDDWIDSNQASFNTALPTAFKNAASATQKSELMMYVLMKRMGRF